MAQLVENRNLINTYYVATAGTGDGSTDVTPMSLADFLTLLPNIANYSRVYLNKGDTFVCQLDVLKRITIDSYGTGADPIIEGSIDISGQTWTLDAGNIYYTTMTFVPKSVSVSDVEQGNSETEFFNSTTRTAADVIQSTSTGLDDYHAGQTLVGAKVIAKQYNFQPTRRRTINTWDGTSLTLDAQIGLYNATLGTYAPANGLPVKILGNRNFINDIGEWSYDASTQRLYIRTAGGAPTNIRAFTHNYGINVMNEIDYVTIQNIDFKHQYLASVNSVNNNYLTITQCTFTHGHSDAIALWGNSRGVTVSYNTMQYYTGSAIRIGAIRNSTITRNTITNIGVQTWFTGVEYESIAQAHREYELGVGVGINSFFDVDAPYESTMRDVEISYNNINNTGYSSIIFCGYGVNVHHNIVKNSCYKWNDGGAIYGVWRPNGLSYGTSNCTIENNIVQDHVGSIYSLDGITGGTLAVMGIYIDNGCNNITVNNNTVDNVQGFSIRTAFDTDGIIVTNNNVRGMPIEFRKWRSAYTNNLQKVGSRWVLGVSNVCTGNIIGITKNNLYCVEVRDSDNSATYNPFSSGGDSDNNHYVNPYTVNIGEYQDAGTTLYTLAAWQTKFTGDAASTERTNYITYSNDTNAQEEVKIEINETEAAVNFNVPAGYTDYSGAAFSNPVSIPAYRSLLYFKDTAFP